MPTAGSILKLSRSVSTLLEKFFYNWGIIVAKNPFIFIFGCVGITFCCLVGLVRFTPENRPDKLWLPTNSPFVKDTDWLRANFPSPIRNAVALLVADDVLEPKIIQLLLHLHDKIKDVESNEGKTWADLCLKLPITKFNRKKRRRRRIESTDYETGPKKINTTKTSYNNGFDEDFEKEFEDEFFTDSGIFAEPVTYDPSVDLPDDVYCEIVNNLDMACYETNLAEMWSYDPKVIGNLTKEDVLHTINNVFNSPIFGRAVNYTAELGGIQKDSDGNIISAKAISLRWTLRVNLTGNIKSSLGTGEDVDEVTLEWEKHYSEVMESLKLPHGAKIYFATGRSWGDISEDTIFDDGSMLAIGFVIMMFYVVFMLGRFNWVEQRPFLSFAGLACVGQAACVSYGLCAVFGVIYGPVNKILPFLLLGIGIDDTFVIAQCWRNLKPEDHRRPLPERIGLALKHAGVSITVTSLTDVAAFGVGATTVLPGLQAFCIYATVGIIAVYIFQTTFFVACFSLDQKRLDSCRNGFIWCYKYDSEHYKGNECGQRNFGELVFGNFFSKFVFHPVSKVIVVLMTLGAFGANLYGNLQLKREFDPVWFLPDDSSLTHYFEIRDHYFPMTGYPAVLVLENVNWTASLQQFDELMTKFEESSAIYQVENWYQDFKTYANANFDTDIPTRPISSKKLQKYLGKFLYSPSGSKYQAVFKVAGNLTCGQVLPSIKIAVVRFKLIRFPGPDEGIAGMHETRGMVANSNLTFNNDRPGRVFPWSLRFVTSETDETISTELYRNVALSLVCVLAVTLVLLADIRVCFFCGVCVILTLVDVGGMMYFWGLTIDIVSCIDIVLATGLCVDYAAHIGLAFMTSHGNRDERAKSAVIAIGPAVLNGGVSTFLAFVLLISSRSHVFKTFFKIFFLVVSFGLFHGLVFLPVILSILGPVSQPPPISKKMNGHSHNNGKELQTLTGANGKLHKEEELQALNGEILTIRNECSG